MANGLSLAAFAEGFAGSRKMVKDREERDAMRALNERMIGVMETQAANGASMPMTYGMGALPDPAGGAADVSSSIGADPDSFNAGQPVGLIDLVDRTEGGGNYDTLFGHSQKDGPFAGRRISTGTVGEAIAFADPGGEYGQWVKGKVGRVATPMGRYQIVGSTLRRTADQMGLDPSTPFNKATQDAMFTRLASNRIRGAKDMAGKMAGLRAEWEGFKHVPDAQLRSAITDFERQHMGGSMGARPPVS